MPPSPEATTPTNQSIRRINPIPRAKTWRWIVGSSRYDDLVRGVTLPRKDNDVVVAGCNPADVQEPYSLCFSCELPSTPLQKGSKEGTLPQQLSRLLLLLLGRFVHVMRRTHIRTACVRAGDAWVMLANGRISRPHLPFQKIAGGVCLLEPLLKATGGQKSRAKEN